MGDLVAPGSPQDWLRHARSDLLLARTRKTRNLLYAHLCFHAQQAAEKALKAVLISHGIRLAKTHDLAFLMDQLPATISLPPALIDLPRLTKYSVQQRYPGEAVPVSSADYRHAVEQAEESIAWASRCLIRGKCLNRDEE